jgi:hypothetical protein
MINAVLQAQVEALAKVEEKHAAAFAAEEEKMKANLAALDEAHESALAALQQKEETIASIEKECNQVLRHSALLDAAAGNTAFPTKLEIDFERASAWQIESPQARRSTNSLLIATKREAHQLLEDLDLEDEIGGRFPNQSLSGYIRSPILKLKAGPRSPAPASRRRYRKQHFAY